MIFELNFICYEMNFYKHGDAISRYRLDHRLLVQFIVLLLTPNWQTNLDLISSLGRQASFNTNKQLEIVAEFSSDRFNLESFNFEKKTMVNEFELEQQQHQQTQPIMVKFKIYSNLHFAHVNLINKNIKLLACLSTTPFFCQ